MSVSREYISIRCTGQCNYMIIMLHPTTKQQCRLFCRLQEGVFVNLYQLRSLHLSYNRITSVEPRALDISAHIPSLTYIDLSENRLTELEPWPLIRAQYRPIKNTFNLANNRIRKFTNTLQWTLNCTSTSLSWTSSLHLDLSSNRIEHISDIFDGWNIDGTTSRYYCYDQRRTQGHDGGVTQNTPQLRSSLAFYSTY